MLRRDRTGRSCDLYQMKNIAIIPARSGSKGLKDKNIRDLCGKPLLSYSIDAARDSNVFDEIMVSTDSERYAAIAKEYGASVPFLRSSATSSDTASSWDTVLEVLDNYAALGRTFDNVCLLQPTSPLRTAEDIKKAYALFRTAQTAVVSVCEVDHSPLWCNTLPEDLSLDGFIKPINYKQRQGIEKYYRINGAVYFVKVSALYESQYLYRQGSYAYIMDKRTSIDIDDEFDFRMAEFLMGMQRNG